MITGVADRLTTLLDNRLQRVAVFPIVLWSLAVGLTGWTADGRSLLGLGEAWTAGSGAFQVFTVVAATAVVLALALLLHGNSTRLIQAFEGYSAPARWLAPLSRDYLWERRWRSGFGDLDKDELLPTALGNVLRAAELYPRKRYGVSALLSWPRLYQVMSAELRQEIAAARSQLELAVNVSFLGGLFALFALVAIPLLGSADRRLLLATVTGGLVVAVAAYLAAVGSAAVYGELIRAAYDLHRSALLETLGYTMPATAADEYRLWQALDNLWRRGYARPPFEEKRSS